MKLSFGMIFSIILIIVFIAFTFYVIKILLENQDSHLVLLFVNGLKDDVDDAWKSPQSSQEIEYRLPKKIDYACFVDYSSKAKGAHQEFYDKLKKLYYEYENLIFYPVDFSQTLGAVEIKHLDIEKITENQNPFCIENINGKVKMIIKKDYAEELVWIER